MYTKNKLCGHLKTHMLGSKQVSPFSITTQSFIENKEKAKIIFLAFSCPDNA